VPNSMMNSDSSDPSQFTTPARVLGKKRNSELPRLINNRPGNLNNQASLASTHVDSVEEKQNRLTKAGHVPKFGQS